MQRTQNIFTLLISLIRSGSGVSELSQHKNLLKNRYSPSQKRAAYRLRQFPTRVL